MAQRQVIRAIQAAVYGVRQRALLHDLRCQRHRPTIWEQCSALEERAGQGTAAHLDIVALVCQQDGGEGARWAGANHNREPVGQGLRD